MIKAADVLKAGAMHMEDRAQRSYALGLGAHPLYCTARKQHKT
jgi:hypothetical protein